MAVERVAVLPGDGIGPEVMAQARRVLEAAAGRFGIDLELNEAPIGQAAFDVSRRMLPRETLQLCRDSRAVLVGPVGGSRWEHPLGPHHPKEALMKLRAWLGTYATLRPTRSFSQLEAIAPEKPEHQRFDMWIVHDHSAGLSYGRPRGISVTATGMQAVNTQAYTSEEVARVARLAFEAAANRGGRVASIDESKVLETGQLWRDSVEEVADGHPAVRLERWDADNFLFELVREPGRFDVVLAEASLGPLIAAAAAGLTGAYAMHPQAFVGGDVPIFQPAHGAAPDLAGRDVANPLAAVRAAGMLLGYGLGRLDAMDAVERAVESALSVGALPAEICGTGRAYGTTEVGAAVVAELESTRGIA